MTFTALSAWQVALIAAGAIAALALLHLLRRPVQELRVVTTLFWAQIVEPQRARTLLGRFRELPAFVILAITCVLLAAGLAHPEWTSNAAAVSKVIVVDLSPSMDARQSDGSTRLDLVRKTLEAEVEALTADDAVAVVVANPAPRLLLGFDQPRALLHAEFDFLHAGPYPAAIHDAVFMTRSLLHERPNPEIVLITDRRTPEPRTPDHSRVCDQFRTVYVGQTVPNASILSAIYEPNPKSPSEGQIVFRMALAGNESVKARLRVHQADQDERLLDEEILIEPNATVDLHTAALRADGRKLEVDLDVTDGLAVDNHMLFMLPSTPIIRVAATEPLPVAIEMALRSDPAVELTTDMGACNVRINPPSSWSGPAIALRDAATEPIQESLGVTRALDLLADLTFDGTVSTTVADVQSTQGEVPLIHSAGRVLASLTKDKTSPVLVLDSALWSQPPYLHRRADWAVFIARTVRHLAGIETTPATLAPSDIVRDPMWACEREHISANITPSDREMLDLAVPEDAGRMIAATPGRVASLGLSEWVLLFALAGMLADLLLYNRGRIA